MALWFIATTRGQWIILYETTSYNTHMEYIIFVVASSQKIFSRILLAYLSEDENILYQWKICAASEIYLMFSWKEWNWLLNWGRT